MKKILTIGSVTQDVFLHTPSTAPAIRNLSVDNRYWLAFEYGSKISLSSLGYACGGGALNASVTFKKFGYQTSLASIIGLDEVGKKILSFAQEMDIDAFSVQTSHELPTAQSFVLPCPRGDRVILSDHGALKELQLSMFLNSLPTHNALYITAINETATQELPEFLQKTAEYGYKVAWNPGMQQLVSSTAQIQKSLQYCSILLVNYEESLALSETINLKKSPNNQEYLQQLMEALWDLGIETIAVTAGKDGVTVGHKDAIYNYASLPAKIVNTLGAGDAFGSALTAALWQNMPIEQAIKLALLNSKRAIESEGATTGLVSLQTMLHEINQ